MIHLVNKICLAAVWKKRKHLKINQKQIIFLLELSAFLKSTYFIMISSSIRRACKQLERLVFCSVRSRLSCSDKQAAIFNVITFDSKALALLLTLCKSLLIFLFLKQMHFHMSIKVSLTIQHTAQNDFSDSWWGICEMRLLCSLRIRVHNVKHT